MRFLYITVNYYCTYACFTFAICTTEIAIVLGNIRSGSFSFNWLLNFFERRRHSTNNGLKLLLLLYDINHMGPHFCIMILIIWGRTFAL